MDYILRRPSLRLPSVLALLTLTILSVVSITSPISSESSLSQVHRRSIELPPLVFRQEDPPAPTNTSTTESTTTSTTSTSTTTTSSTSTTTSTSTSKSTTSTRTVTSTRATSTSTTTQTVRSTTSGSNTGTTTTSVPTSTGTSSTSTGESQQTTGLTAATDPVSGTTLVVAPGFVPGSGNTNTGTTPGSGARTSGEASPTSTIKSGESTAAAKKSFWDNKGAVAGVFVLISVVVIAILVVLWRSLARRRAAARQKRLTSQLFGGKYAESDFASTNDPHTNNRASSIYGDVENFGGGNTSRFQGAPVTVGASTSNSPYGSNNPYGTSASSSNPWSPPPMPPVASNSRNSPEAGISTAYQPPHSAASTYETAQSHYYTPAGSEQSHGHYASNVPTVTVTSPQRYMAPSQAMASASSISAYSQSDPTTSAPPTAFKGLGGAGDRVSYDSFYGGKAI